MHFYFCILIFNVSHSLHLNSYSFIIVLTYVAYCVYCCFYHCIMYSSIQLQSCQSVYNKLTYLLTYCCPCRPCGVFLACVHLACSLHYLFLQATTLFP